MNRICITFTRTHGVEYFLENHTPEKGVWDTHNESIGESCDSDDDNFFMPDRSKSMTPSSGPANCGCVTSTIKQDLAFYIHLVSYKLISTY